MQAITPASIDAATAGFTTDNRAHFGSRLKQALTGQSALNQATTSEAFRYPPVAIPALPKGKSHVILWPLDWWVPDSVIGTLVFADMGLDRAAVDHVRRLRQPGSSAKFYHHSLALHAIMSGRLPSSEDAFKSYELSDFEATSWLAATTRWPSTSPTSPPPPPKLAHDPFPSLYPVSLPHLAQFWGVHSVRPRPNGTNASLRPSKVVTTHELRREIDLGAGLLDEYWTLDE